MCFVTPKASVCVCHPTLRQAPAPRGQYEPVNGHRLNSGELRPWSAEGSETRYPIYCLNAGKLLPQGFHLSLNVGWLCVWACVCSDFKWPGAKGCTWDVPNTIGKNKKKKRGFFPPCQLSRIHHLLRGSIIFWRGAAFKGILKIDSIHKTRSYYNNNMLLLLYYRTTIFIFRPYELYRWQVCFFCFCPL